MPPRHETDPTSLTSLFADPPLSIKENEEVLDCTRSFLTNYCEAWQTKDTYARALKRFFTWCDTKGKTLLQVNRALLLQYDRHMAQQYSNRQINFDFATIRGLFNWFIEQGLVVGNPASGIKNRDTSEAPTVQILTIEQVEALFDSASTASLKELRNRALLAALMHGMLSTEAVVALKVKDFFRRNDRYWLRIGESDAERCIPANAILEEFILDYLEKTPFTEPFRPLFPIVGLQGKHTRGEQLSHRAVQRAVKEVAKRASLDVATVTPKSLRATGIHYYFSQGGSLERAVRLTGRHVVNLLPFATDASNEVIYEGDLDGLMGLLSDSAVDPLREFARRAGVFRLTIQREEDT